MKRRTILVCSLLVGLLLAGALAVRHAGTWLVVEDAVKPSRAVVVLGGQLPFRALEAARLYKDGAAEQVWLTQGAPTDEDLALKRLGLDVPEEYVYSRQALERVGVPSAAIRVLPGAVVNTADEIRVAAQELRRAGGGRIILVTSKYHGRRVKVLWRKIVGGQSEAIVRYTPEDSFSPERWWRSTSDSLSVTREWLGLVNAWFGFPVPARRTAG